MSDLRGLVQYLRGYVSGMRLCTKEIAEREAAYCEERGDAQEAARWRGIAEGTAIAATRIEAQLNEWLERHGS